MGNKTNSLFRWGFLAAALLLVLEVRAASIRIDIDTNALGLNGQNWDLAFDLTKGNVDQQPNTASILNFAITGGALTNPTFYPMTDGNVTGTLPGTVTLKDVDSVDPSLPSFFNEYTHNADLGSLISFVLDITANKDGGLEPDAFAFFFIDPATGLPFPTADPTGALFVYSIGNDNQPTSFCPITAPCVLVTPVAVQAPEPSALALAVAALLALGFTRATRRAALRKRSAV